MSGDMIRALLSHTAGSMLNIRQSIAGQIAYGNGDVDGDGDLVISQNVGIERWCRDFHWKFTDERFLPHESKHLR